MGENSKIEWTDHTFNPWIGCTKVSDGCKHCYAETLMDKRYGKVKWGPQGTRVRTSDSYWQKPLAWNKRQWMECGVCHWRGDVQQVPFVNTEEGGSWACPNCTAAGRMEPTRQRVFCASLADVFEDHPQTTDKGYVPGMENDLNRWRLKLLKLIHQTPNLDWLLLTKRPENVWPQLHRYYGYDLDGDFSFRGWPRNCWLGISVENQDELDGRWPVLESAARDLRIPVIFLSCEPLLGPLDLEACLDEWDYGDDEDSGWTRAVDWVIVGGESGPKARPFNLGWARDIIKQCREADVPVFMKQIGSNPATETNHEKPYLWQEHLDKKGADLDKWPVELQVREFPSS